MKHYIISHTKTIPKTKKEIKGERVKVINKYMDGNLLRFLRKHYKDYQYELIYSVYIKRWKKKEPKLYNLLYQVLKDRNGLVWPKHVKNVVNIMRTFNTHYGMKMNIHTCKVALMVDDLFDIDIYKYHSEHKQRLLVKDVYTLKNLTREEALKEQKAQGFINSIDFEDYDPKFAHLVSNIDNKLVYPYNFSHDILYKTGTKNIIYQIGMELAGVPGFTRIRIPQN